MEDKSTEGLHASEKVISKLENDCRRITVPDVSELGIEFIENDVDKIAVILCEAKKSHEDILRILNAKSIVEIGEIRTLDTVERKHVGL